MTVKVTPSPLKGRLRAISSKSCAHRALIAAGLADKATTITLNILSEDIVATMNCLKAMGCTIRQEEANGLIRLLVEPMDANKSREPFVLDCNESGSTARFLLPVAASVAPQFTMTGKGKLPTRPLTPLRREMEQKGCTFQGEAMPFTVTGALQPGEYRMEGNVSSQFISGLLFALPLLAGDSRIVLTSPLESAPYVDITLETLAQFGVAIEKEANGFLVKGGQCYVSPELLDIQGDWSNGAFVLAMGAVGGDVTLTGLRPDASQGDKAIVPLLEAFGANVTAQQDAFTVKQAPLTGITIDVAQIPDLVPCLASVAALSKGETRIINGSRLKIKESNRIQTTHDALTALGADITMTDDGLIIRGKEKLAGGEAQGYGDHRIVMALAIAASGCANPVVIHGAEAVNKSYPGFFEDLQLMGGVVDHVVHAGE